MNYDQYGYCWTDPEELFDMLYQNPDLALDKFLVQRQDQPYSGGQYNKAVESTYAPFPKLQLLRQVNVPVADFDEQQQAVWYMPEQYKQMDIAKWVLDQCESQAELQRCGQELLMYADRNLIDLLRYLKYFVDTMRLNNIVWGLGRGSSVASYVLYLIGVHKIDSMYYDLDIHEFLK